MAQQTGNSSPVAVPDQATAVKLAEKALAKIYGRKQIQSERPFSAELTEGIWHVAGTLYCKDNRGNVITGDCVGGVASAEIRQSDGRVLKTGHTM
ncbi:MAG TPA: NTF2 fold immunity protein [Terriglobales bacterium]